MKFELMTLLSVGLYFASVVSANYDYYSEDNDDGQQCHDEIMQCLSHVQQYQVSDPHQMAALMRQAGPRAACKDSTEVANCVLQVIRSGKCNGIPESAKRNFQNSFDLNNYLCVDKINDLENHWECLINSAMYQNFGACENMTVGLQQCDSSTYMSCVERTFNSSSLCKAGAIELVRDVINRMIEIMPHCSDHTTVHSAVMNFLRKK
jgi:hypothetical protein